MHIKGYPLEIDEDDDLIFYFTNEGRSGSYRMAIIYMPTDDWPNVYNLGFGAVVQTEVNGEMQTELDDEIQTNNNNIQEILGTVAQSMFRFWEKYQDKSIFITGSTPLRTRLYDRIIANYGHQLEGYALFYGLNEFGEVVEYRPRKGFVGFFIEPIAFNPREAINL